jgi:hypothetical protein
VKPLPVSVALAVLLAAVLPGQDLPPWVLLLARVKQHGRADFEHIPDYTCHQTVSRSVKPLGSQSFTPVQPAALSSESLIVSGEISATPLNLFVHDAGRITVSSEAVLHDGTMFRFDFEVSALAGAYQVQSGEGKTMVGVRGSFWVDSQSLDLLRIEEHAVDLPPDFEARDVVRTTTYGRTRIGSSDVLLPRSSELMVTDSSGVQQRNLVEFSGCRESAGTGQPGQYLPQSDPVTRVKQHGHASFEHIPSYVCRQTVKRFEKPRNASAFKPAGGESLEVASGGERDSLLLAMVRRPCDPDEVVVADHGFAAASVSPSLVRNVFVYGNARITRSTEERVLGKPALRYEFEMTEALSGFTARTREREVTSGVSGTFWVDAETLDLVRIEEHAEGFSWRLGIHDIAIAINYGRTRIGSSDALLPQSAETVVSDPRGGQKKTMIEFTGCRESGGEPK